MIGKPPLWKKRSYRFWLLADSALAFGLGINQFGIPLFAQAATGSPAAAGLLVTSAGLAVAVGLAVGGMLADRGGRTASMLASGLMSCVTWGGLVVLARFHHSSFLVLACACFAASALSAVSGPILLAELRAIVPPDQLPLALSVRQARNSALGIVAGPLAALLLSAMLYGPILAEVFGTGVFLVVFARARAWPQGPAREHRARGFRAIGRALRRREFLALLIQWPLFNFCITLAFMAVLFAQGVAGVSASAGAAFFTVTSCSTLIGSLMTPWLVRRCREDALLVGCRAWTCAALFAACFFASPWALAAALALAYLPLPLHSSLAATKLYTIVDPAVTGRAAGLMNIAVFGVSELAPAAAGWAVGHANVVFALAGSATPLLAVTIMGLVSGTRKFRAAAQNVRNERRKVREST